MTTRVAITTCSLKRLDARSSTSRAVSCVRAHSLHPRRAALTLRVTRERARQARSSASSASIAAVEAASASATDRRELVCERVGDDLGGDHPEHRAAGEAEPERYEAVEEGDEEEGRDGDERLRQAREDAPAGGVQHPDAAGDEDEADRETLGDVVDRDRDRGHEPELFAAAEGDADTDAFGERVHGHDADEQERLAGIGVGERLEVDVLPSSQPTRRPGDEEDAHEGAAGHPQEALARALVEEEPLAAIMNPAASAFATPTQERARCATKRKGTAPRPVASAVTSAAAKTARTPGSSIAQAGCSGWAKMTSTLSCS